MLVRVPKLIAGVVVLHLLCVCAASAAVELIDAVYRPDRFFPEFYSFWKSTYKWGDAVPPSNPGAALAVYLYNNGTSAVTISDITINGRSLASAMRCTEETFYCDKAACGTGTDATMVAAGEPLWWRVSQNPVPPGGTTEVYVRMRAKKTGTLSISVASVSATVPMGPEPPRIAGIGFSPDGTKLSLYLRHPVKGTAPSQILIDNVDRTASCVIAPGDPDYDIQPVYCNLGAAFARGSYHTFQALYSDGSKATDGIRVYVDDFKYCTWGGTGVNPELHSVNLRQGVSESWDVPSGNRYAFFLCDEPDAHESLQGPTKYPPYCPGYLGALSQKLSDQSQGYKVNQAQYPTQLNINGSFKPNNYYVYGHVTDIVSVDPYYQTRILDSYWYDNLRNTIPWYRKATYIYAVSSSCQAAVEPRTLQIILNSCRKQDTDDETGQRRVFRWATPEEKRIEFYYALAAGAKQIAYWWMAVVSPSQDAFAGIGNATEPGSSALWREMGLLGAEGGTASPVIVNSCPVTVQITKPGRIWARALLSGGPDTLVLICVNDDYVCDQAGTIIRSVPNVQVGVDLPNWLTAPTNVFEVDYKGIRDVPHGISNGRINLYLGRVDVSRMIIITKDSTLKSTLQSRYTGTYAPRVTQLISMQ